MITDKGMRKYKNLIRGLNKKYWKMVFKLGSEEEIAAWSIDKFLEAYAALKVFEEESKEGVE